MKIVFLGDSLTWGGYGGNWVALVAERMPDHEIVNAGVGGDTVWNLLQRVDSLLAQQPDAMFVMVGGNDAVSYAMPDTRPYYKSSKQLPDGFITPEAFEQLYRQLLTKIQLEYVQAFVGLPPTEYNAELVRLRHIYNEAAQRVAASLNVPVLDFATPFIPAQPIEREPISLAFIREIGQRSASGWNDYESERRRWGYTYTFDGIHLMPEAAHAFAERVEAFLRQYLR